MKLTSIIGALSLFATLTLAFAAPPKTINYQGYLKNGTAPAGGPLGITFSLYSSNPARNNNHVWRETQPSVAVTNGIYSTQLGSVVPITAPFDVPYYLGVKVGTEAEMTLQPLSSVPYALRSSLADSVTGSSIGTAAIADGSITTSKIADGAVTDIKISGPISAGKIPDLAGLQASMTSLQSTLEAQQTTINQLTSTTSQQQGVIDALQIQISHLNTPPDVSPGSDLFTAPGTMVILYGKVTDPDQFQLLSWAWSIVSKPVGSTALLSSTAETTTLFTPDTVGSYQFMLTASDGITTVTANATLTVTAGMQGQAQLLETDNAGNATFPQVAMDSSGNAMAVWYQSDGIRSNIWANRYVNGSGWGTPQLIETDNAGAAVTPQIAIDSSGNAMAVWYQSDGIRYNMWANRYLNGIGWETAQLIETDNTGNTFTPQVAMDSSGNAMAVWQQPDGTKESIWANRYTNGTGWGTAQLIETDTGFAQNPQVAMDSNGNALAVWHQFDGIRDNIWANRYINGSGWAAAELIETDNAGSAVQPQVTMDGSGNALAVWQQSDGTRSNIWANRYSNVAGWGTAGLIETDNTGNAQKPQLAIDSSGNALAVWQQSDGTRDNIWANRYLNGTGWATAQLIEADTAGSAADPQVTMDSSGNAVAVWWQSDGTRFNIWANRYLNASGWGTASLIETDNAGNALFPQVAMGNNGNALVLWHQFDGIRYNIWANQLSVGWRQATLLETDNAGAAINPQVAMDASGNGMAVWSQSDGLRNNLWANRYVNGSGWSTPVLIENDNAGNAFGPQVAMDSNGNAIAVWHRQANGFPDSIYANRYVSGSGWGTAEVIETDETGNASEPQVTMDASGNALAVWYQLTGGTYNIWSNRYVKGTGWSTAVLVETDNTSDAVSPRVAVDPAGNAVVVWYQVNGGRYSIYANRYTVGTGWGMASLIENDSAGDAFSPQVAMDAGGNAMAIWYQSNGTQNSIYANRYVNGSGWGTPVLVENDTAGEALYPRIALDSSGNALAVWQQSDGSRINIMSNQYSSFSGWGGPRLLETNNSGDATIPQLSMNANGHAVATWQQRVGVRDNIWATRFTPGVGWGLALLINSISAVNTSNPDAAMGGNNLPLVVWQQHDSIGENIWANRPWK